MNDLDKKAKKFAVYFGLALFVFSLVVYSVFSVPQGFGKNRLISIKQGSGLSEIADRLEKDGVIKSSFAFKSLVFLSGRQKNIKAGDYFFEKPASALGVIYRISGGIYGLSSTRATIPEGWTNYQIGGYFESLGFFTQIEWMKASEGKEGYLFPDTYFFLPNVSPERAVEIMRKNFDKKVDTVLLSEISRQKKKLSDVIIMASIIEKEMSSFQDGRVISGILWKRLGAGMGLQVDAALTYVTGKTSAELTEKDLALDSPYNTYKHRGLSPTPIGNPGLDAIRATVYPEKTLYWYYLHGRDGDPRYSIDFEGHKENKIKYLR